MQTWQTRDVYLEISSPHLCDLLRNQFMSSSVLVLVLLIVLCTACLGGDSHILRIDMSNFTAVVSSKSLLLINYYATWCGFCKTLETELRYVAAELVNQRIDATLAVIDATIPENEALAGPQGINGYPSLILYRNGQRVSDYTGGRSRGELVDYLRRKTGPPADPISTLEEIDVHVRQLAAAVGVENGVTALALGLFPPATKESGQGPQGKAAQVFLSAASSYDHAKFLLADNLELVRHFNVDGPTMIIFTGNDAGLTGMIPLQESMDEDDVIYALLTYSIPLIIRYDQQTQPYLSSLLIKAHVLIFHDDLPLSVELLSTIDAVAPQFRGKLVFIQVGSDQHQLMQVFGLQTKNLPELQLADMSDPLHMRRFGLGDYLTRRALKDSGGADNAHGDASNNDVKDISVATVTAFLSDYFAGTLPRSLFSENAAEVDKAKTKIKLHGRHVEIQNVVAHNFQQRCVAKKNTSYPTSFSDFLSLRFHFSSPLYTQYNCCRVMDDESVNTLLYVYVPWCAHCKSFEPVMAELALQYRDDACLNFARIDGSKNEVDHPVVRVRGYPSIFLFPAFDKLNPIEYDGERTVSSFVQFISQFRRGRKNDTSGGGMLEAEVMEDVLSHVVLS